MLLLQELIDCLCSNSKIKICIHDVTGLLTNEKLKISPRNKIHFCDFCNAAKSTQRGYELCISCKSLANAKAISTQKPFCGYCPWGIFEAVYPVVINNAVQCIVYAGNAITDRDEYRKRSERAFRITGVERKNISSALNECEISSQPEKLMLASKTVSSFIVLISDFYMYDKQSRPSAENRMSNELKEYVSLNFRRPLTLASLSKVYYVSEKYLGRIIKKALGMSFHAYLNEVRLHNAAALLRTQDMTVTDIALDSGFENVTYFNRMFKRKFGITPTRYRTVYKNRAAQPELDF